MLRKSPNHSNRIHHRSPQTSTIKSHSTSKSKRTKSSSSNKENRCPNLPLTGKPKTKKSPRYSKMQRELTELKNEVQEMRKEVQKFKQLCIQSLPGSAISPELDKNQKTREQSRADGESRSGVSTYLGNDPNASKIETLRQQQRAYYVEYYLAH